MTAPTQSAEDKDEHGKNAHEYFKSIGSDVTEKSPLREALQPTAYARKGSISDTASQYDNSHKDIITELNKELK